MYKCLNCGEEMDLKQVKEKIRCVYCGHRILLKQIPKTVMKVKSD